MSVLYSNVDQLVNKRHELLLLIAGAEPDIIMLTEIIPKAQTLPLSPAVISLPGYSMYINFNAAL